MKTHNGKYENGMKIHPDYICNRCRQPINGGMMQITNETHFCIACYNMIMQAQKLTAGPLFNQKQVA